MPFIKGSKSGSIRELLNEQMTVKDFQNLHRKLRLPNRVWLGRRLNAPGTFTMDELKRLVAITGTTATDLMDVYGIGIDTITAAQADDLRRKDLTAANIPAGQPAGPVDNS